MVFHEFGNTDNPIVILIHGCLQPWQSLLPIAEHFKENYRVIIPALDGHTSENKSCFVSVENEAQQIESHILSEYGCNIFALCGFSMGGIVAWEILRRGHLKVESAIIDGAPLVATGKLMTKIMTNNYLSIVRKSKARDKNTLRSFCKNFLPEKYLADYLSFIDNIDEESITNMLCSINKKRIPADFSLNGTKLMYIHGTKGNEIISGRVGKLIAKYYPDAYVICFKGDGHCECAIFEPEDWSKTATDFFLNR